MGVHLHHKKIYAITFYKILLEERDVNRIVKDIKKLLEEALECLEAGKINRLKNVSDHVIHNATIYQDPYSIMTAVIIYALAKIFEREKVRLHHPNWKKFIDVIKRRLRSAIKCLEKDDLDCFEREMKKVEIEIYTSEEHYKMYIDYVMEKARIKKGSRIYEHGPSLEKTANLLGISVWELMEYIGKTNIHGDIIRTKSVEERQKDIEEVLE